jgi:hypothetical protein
MVCVGSIRAQAPSPKPEGTLAQVMRGILFPNSNLIFAVQSEDPGVPREAQSGGTGSLADPYAGVYPGWQMIENASLALSEAANLLMIPGRVCENGRPAPLDQEDWPQLVEGLRAAGRAAYDAAKTKNQTTVSDATFQVADACDACHSIYRDKPNNANRCIP